jgi:hypothetical protein
MHHHELYQRLENVRKNWASKFHTPTEKLSAKQLQGFQLPASVL